LVLFEKNDILFGAMRPYFHKVCVAPYDGVTRTTVLTLAAINENYRYFSLLMLFQESTIAYATHNSSGSTIPYIKWNDELEKYPIIIPNENLLEKYNQMMQVFIDAGIKNIECIKSLNNLRDILLPRLISGKLDLSNVEERLEGVA